MTSIPPRPRTRHRHVWGYLDHDTKVPSKMGAFCIECDKLRPPGRKSTLVSRTRYEAEAAAGPPASAERVTRESLAAALMRQDYTPLTAYEANRLAEAALAALPEAAVQEPDWAAKKSDPTATVALWRAAQPASDLDVELLADRLNDLLEHYGVAILRPEALGYARALAATFQARESGGEP